MRSVWLAHIVPCLGPDDRRHRPEHTALFALVAEHYPRFIQAIEASGGHLPAFVQRDFEDDLS